MREFTSLRVGGEADIILFPENMDQLQEVVSTALSCDIPLYPLGGGTNLLVSDQGIRGAVVSLFRGFNYISKENGRGAIIKVGAGASLSRVCLYALNQGLEGLEGLVGIPGSLGGCLTMNAGRNSISVGDRAKTVKMLTEKGKLISFPRQDIDFGYRRAEYPARGVIVEAELTLKKRGGRVAKTSNKPPRSRQVLPFNAGSIFKNPPGQSAGALVEECGLKGEREGDAQISHLHGNIIVNRGNAKAAHILKLIERAREKVAARFDIQLETEIRVIGEQEGDRGIIPIERC
jgi:UDP-N-acetylmuramate dehydrogenase